MKIVIYNTNTNEFDRKNFYIKQLPECAVLYKSCLKKYTSSEIILAYQLPSTFLLDFSGEEIFEKQKNIN